jgi:glycosyltransferase involved in cell wall biosynthesis
LRISHQKGSSKLLSREAYPRVLVVGHAPFSRATGTVIALSNLFAGWPKDRLGQIYTAHLQPATEICEKYFHFPPSAHYRAAQYRAMRGLGWDGHSALQQSRPAALMQTATRSRPTLTKIYRHISAIPDLSPVRATTDMTEWVRDFCPDLIYSMLGSVRMTRIVALVADACGAPVVPHFTDDWAATLYDNGQLFGRADRALQSGLKQIIRLAPLGLVISRAMADEYNRRHRIPFFPFMNCVDESYFGQPPDEEPQLGQPTELVYVGALHLNRWKSLRDIGIALNDVSGAGLPVRLTVHSPQRDLDQYRKQFVHLRHVRIGPALESHEVPAALKSASVLVHVESFDDEIRRYTHYSVSTKIPQYLAAARPILGYGPTELASIEHIRQADAGVTVGTNSPEELVRAVMDICRDSALRHRLARNGATYARQEHAKDRVAARFASTLRAAANTYSTTPDAARQH